MFYGVFLRFGVVAVTDTPKVDGRIHGDRPGRIEPRAVKRRPKPHALLTKPRAEAKAELIRQTSPQLLAR